MICDNKPMEKGNAISIAEVCNSVKLLMLKYEAIADYYSEEPFIIKINLTKNDDSPSTFEQVLRIRQWIPNEKTISWCVYSEDRSWGNNDDKPTVGLVIRKVKWNKFDDLKNYRENPEVKRSDWPTLTLENCYVPPTKALNVIRELRDLDLLIENGILLSDRSDFGQNHNWNEHEIRRCFDWGTVQAVWHPFKANGKLESMIERLNQIFNGIINEETDTIYQMELDYTVPTDMYKKLIFG